MRSTPTAAQMCVAILAFGNSADAWNTQPSPSSIQVGRREAFVQASKMLFVAGSVMAVDGMMPEAAQADISDGNTLPKGAAQFNRMVRAKGDLLSVYNRVAKSSSEMDKKEWDNVGQFLRKLYGVAENDMKDIANTMPDPAKRKRGLQLVDDMKRTAKAGDGPAGAQNASEFLKYDQKIVSILNEFMELLQDVPDEI